MKPVASGCAVTADGLRNADALTLIQAARAQQPYEQVNPYAFEPAIAPHIAAAQAGVVIDAGRIERLARSLSAEAERLLVEGAGGWRVPLGGGLDMAGLAQRLGLPVILVVGMRLGCINHALLSAEAIERDGCLLAGGVANRVDPDMAEWEANLQTLQGAIAAPCLGVLPWLADPSARQVAPRLTLPE
jgi:dethiobiotin synthetase